jgi:hypothetical protein
MQWHSEQDRAASWAALRQRLILAGILADPAAPPETIARALRERQIVGPEDVAPAVVRLDAPAPHGGRLRGATGCRPKYENGWRGYDEVDTMPGKWHHPFEEHRIAVAPHYEVAFQSDEQIIVWVDAIPVWGAIILRCGSSRRVQKMQRLVRRHRDRWAASANYASPVRTRQHPDDETWLMVVRVASNAIRATECDP